MVEAFSMIEIAAFALGIASVYLTTKQNILCWPTGIAMTFLYVFIFMDARLYSDMLENLIYIFMQAYGWYYWLYGNKKKKDNVHVTTVDNRFRLIWLSVIIIGTILLGYFMANYTNADLAYWDALTTVMSLTAQWLMSKKKIENWVLWIMVDVMALFIYSIKGLYMTTGLYAIFLVLAIMGLMEWRRSMKKAL